MFVHAEARHPFDRSPTNGFRAVKYDSAEPLPDELTREVALPERDYSREEPVSDEIFEIYRTQFSYDPGDLNAVIESVDDTSERWTKEKVTFDAAYGNERVIAYLFVPKNVDPPYQTVVYFPGASVIAQPSSETLVRTARTEFIVSSGRAVMYPIYKGTYERNDGLTSIRSNETNEYKDYMIKWVKDLKTSVDYLESRDDIDAERLAYFGLSWGARLGNMMLAVEERFTVGVLAMGGLPTARSLPEIDLVNFVPRISVPVLMLNGELDHIYPLETSQKPMVALLGTPAEHKRHIVYPDIGHDMFGRRRNQVIGEVLDWLDKYLGPVE